MTHEELLEKIYYIKALWVHPAYVGFQGLREAAHSMNALRAVVELHKPRLMTYAGEPPIKAETCEFCGYMNIYPCPTIQAIEKELGL